MRKSYSDYRDLCEYYQEACVKFNRADYKGAIENIFDAIEFWSDNAEYYDLRGLCKMRLGHYEKAIEDFTKALYFEEWNASAYNNRGTAKAKLGRYEEALQDFVLADKFWRDYLKEYYPMDGIWEGFMLVDEKGLFAVHNSDEVNKLRKDSA